MELPDLTELSEQPALSELPLFHIIDKVKWQGYLDKLWDDPVGNGIIRFAATWANLMELETIFGRSVADCAEEEAKRTERMIGGTADFTYGYAMEMLVAVWGYGEELADHYRHLR